MTDRMTPTQRHLCMASIKGKNTKPEMIVRKFLFSHGFRYRIHVKKLPGCPDIVLRKYKTAIFVDGCFWHGHDECRFSQSPKTNPDFWRHKIELNKARDYRVNVELQLLGWKVIRIWECGLKNREIREQTLNSLLHYIATPSYSSQSQESLIAAENTVPYGTDSK